MLRSIRNTLAGLWTLIVGLRVTHQNFWLPRITVHYPREEAGKLEGFRGHIELISSEEDPIVPKCIVCGNCSQICPSGCIKITSKKVPVEPEKKEGEDSEGEEKPKKKKTKKQLTQFNLDFNYCCLCGLCVQNCPANSLRFSNEIYLAGESREEFEFDLLQRLQTQAHTQKEKD